MDVNYMDKSEHIFIEVGHFWGDKSNFNDDFRLEDDGINMENNTSTWSS